MLVFNLFSFLVLALKTQTVHHRQVYYTFYEVQQHNSVDKLKQTTSREQTILNKIKRDPQNVTFLFLFLANHHNDYILLLLQPQQLPQGKIYYIGQTMLSTQNKTKKKQKYY